MKTKLLALAFLAVLLNGCHHKTLEDYDKSNARWGTWSLEVTTNRADTQLKECVTTLKVVEEDRAVLTAQIHDEKLTADVREDLKVQRGQVFQHGQLALAKLHEFVNRFAGELTQCKSEIERTQLDQAKDNFCFERVKKAEAKLVALKASEKAISDAWQNYTQGQPLPELK